MDLCCLIAGVENESLQKAPAPSASELVETLAKLIREETDYTVMPLPKARIPIIKISRSPTADVPYDISCDIGFENRLALENTRLLLTYAMVDPPRLRTLVLFCEFAVFFIPFIPFLVVFTEEMACLRISLFPLQ